jgi:hypothetical protein
LLIDHLQVSPANKYKWSGSQTDGGSAEKKEGKQRGGSDLCEQPAPIRDKGML